MTSSEKTVDEWIAGEPSAIPGEQWAVRTESGETRYVTVNNEECGGLMDFIDWAERFERKSVPGITHYRKLNQEENERFAALLLKMLEDDGIL